jgi:hypothetical protein
MAIYKKDFLSESDGGIPIKIGASVTPGTPIHSTDNFPLNIDEVWLYANNSSGSAVTLTIEYGGTASPDNLITFSLPASSSMTKIIPGMIISANSNFESSNISAFASTADVVTVMGFVNKIVEIEDFDES